MHLLKDIDVASTQNTHEEKLDKGTINLHPKINYITKSNFSTSTRSKFISYLQVWVLAHSYKLITYMCQFTLNLYCTT